MMSDTEDSRKPEDVGEEEKGKISSEEPERDENIVGLLPDQGYAASCEPRSFSPSR